MVGNLFKGFQFLHAVLLVLSAAGFFIFWARTRFWLPKYAHVLAAIGLLVGIWCVSTQEHGHGASGAFNAWIVGNRTNCSLHPAEEFGLDQELGINPRILDGSL